MNLLFKYCLVLILFCSYGAASLEINEKESRQNYSKETHEYILSEKQAAQFSSVDVKKPDDVKEYYPLTAFAHQLFRKPGLYNSGFVYTFYSPPRLTKIYLYNSVFLI